MKKRIEWIDVAKGVGILLVVFEHVLMAYTRRAGNSSIIHTLPVRIIVGFYMPLFFFLSGIFIKSVLKHSFKKAFNLKFRRLMVPYFVWGIISVIFFAIYTHSSPVLRIIELPIRPIFVLWFVYTLFLISLLFYILEKFCGRNEIILISLVMYVIGKIFSLENDVAIDSGEKVIVGVLQYFVFVYLGYLMKEFLIKMNKKVVIVAAAFVSILLLIVLNIIKFKEIYLSVFAGFLIAILGIVFVCMMCKLVTSFPVIERPFSYMGKASMQIYLIHKLVVEATSIIIFHISTNVFVFTIFNILITLVICFIITAIINKLGWNKLFFGA